MPDLRVVWWNLDWQSAAHTDAQIEAVLSLPERPDVVALAELNAARARVWRRRLLPEGYRFARSPPAVEDHQLRVLLGARLPIRRARIERFAGIWPRAIRSARLDLGGRPIDIHAVHIPNGSANGWIKIDHLLAVRRALQPPHPAPQILCGDFNTPQSETTVGLTTFGQTLAGTYRTRPSSPRPFTADRPWDATAWDLGERAVLEGLPNECDMPDAFRSRHPDAIEATWVPRGLDERYGRRLDHVFASAVFEIVSCRHLHDWRHVGLSDHSALEAHLRLS